MLGLCLPCTLERLEGYEKRIEAVKLLAETEGILLDPIYTGRAMAALIGQVHAGKIKRDDTVIFYHSGGLPGIFGHSEKLLGLKSAKKGGIT